MCAPADREAVPAGPGGGDGKPMGAPYWVSGCIQQPRLSVCA